MKLRSIWYLFNSKPIVFGRTKISKDAWYIFAPSNHKVAISVIISEAVLESVQFKTTELKITSPASFINISLQLKTETEKKWCFHRLFLGESAFKKKICPVHICVSVDVTVPRYIQQHLRKRHTRNNAWAKIDAHV